MKYKWIIISVINLETIVHVETMINGQLYIVTNISTEEIYQ